MKKYLLSLALVSIAFLSLPLSASAANTYATWNPSDIYLGGSGNLSLTNGNLTVTTQPGSPPGSTVRSGIGKSAGKWYWEITCDSTTGSAMWDFGIARVAASFAGAGLGTDTLGWGYVGVNGQLRNNSIDSGAGATYTAGDVIGIALDMDGLQVKFYKNNVLQYTQAIAAGMWYAANSGVSATTALVSTTNFGASAFTYTPPSGYNSGLYAPSESDRDTYFPSVALLLHMDGANGGTTFTDSSSNAYAMTVSGGVTDTGTVKYGTASGKFANTTDKIYPTDTTVLPLGSGDFTLEFWMKMPTIAGGSYGNLVSTGASTGNYIISAGTTGIGGTNNKLNIWTLDGTLSSATTVTDNVWHHIAWTRSGTTARLFVDGTQEATIVDNENLNGWNLTYGGIGAGYHNAQATTYIDDLRITKGVARYTASFNPSAAAFQNQGPLVYAPAVAKYKTLGGKFRFKGGRFRFNFTNNTPFIAGNFDGVKVYYNHNHSDPVRAYVDWSVDNSNWNNAGSVGDWASGEFTLKSTTFTAPGRKRYWRLRFTDPQDSNIGNQSDAIMEVTWRQAGAYVTTKTGVTVSQTGGIGGTPGDAYDNSDASGTTSINEGATLVFDFGQ